MAVRQVGRVDPSPPEAHGRQALQVRPLRKKFLQIRSSCLAHETASVKLNLKKLQPPRKVIKKGKKAFSPLIKTQKMKKKKKRVNIDPK